MNALGEATHKLSLPHLTAWTDVILCAIGDAGANRQHIDRHIARALETKRLRCNVNVCSKTSNMLRRLHERGRIKFDRSANLWSRVCAT